MGNKKVKVLKDYHIIRHYAKKIAGVCEFGKTKNGKVDKNQLTTYIKYGDANVLISFIFDKKRCKMVAYEISEIYNLYGKGRFASAKQMATAFASVKTWYDVDAFDEFVEVHTDLSNFAPDPDTLSQGLDEVGLFMFSMNEFLGKNVNIISEANIRYINVNYMKRQKIIYGVVSLVSLALIIVGFAFANATDGATAGLSAIAVLTCLYGVVRFIYYKKGYDKAVRLYNKVK